ncbi:GGDEF domain-containing response regulator [Pleionea litopenaei]|uniref:Response regulator n=1 Tax=Pleionea litopenaei TaxID=3070815 RepID=A0AA51X5X7_9GAMM|nr:response regulator [Pleionea sp. HL-JVS1]WMS86304.1 response regulator [Pleionea sp. HL-JVS1]
MNTELSSSSQADFKKIICRRVPIKLQQFARLLSDIIQSEVDTVRIKAMESQIRKTKETCLEYGVESTANLLAKIESQLHLNSETIESQKPLIQRFVQRLESHAERLKLGQINSGTTQAVKETRLKAEASEAASSADDSKAEKNSAIDLNAPLSFDDPAPIATETEEVPEASVTEAAQDASSPQVFDDQASLDSEPQITENATEATPHVPTADDSPSSADASALEEMAPSDLSQPQPHEADTNKPELSDAPHQEPSTSDQVSPAPNKPLAPEFEFKHSIVDDHSSTPKLLDSSSELTIYWCLNDDSAFSDLKNQMVDFGYNLLPYELNQAIQASAGDSAKVVVAHLNDFEEEQPDCVNSTSHFIVLSEHDTLEQRLKGVRLGATLFFAEPIDTIKLMEYLDSLESTGPVEPFRVAVMEDSKAQAKFNDKVLTSAGFETCIVIEPMELLNALSNFDPEVIFMDMQMPGCNGIELTKVLRQQERFKTVPIVFLSAEENHEKQREAMTSGGTAFIEKPVKKEQLLFSAELYARRSRSLQPHLARDFQTGLNSPALLKEQITIEAERAMRQNDTMFLALIEMNDLASLNQQHGYAFGERAMQQLARLLQQRLRKTDCVGYFDSHRIGVILSHCSDQEAERIISYLTQSFASNPVAFEGQRIKATLSVGLSRLGSDFDIQRLVRRADAALSEAQNRKSGHLIWAHEAK